MPSFQRLLCSLFIFQTVPAWGSAIQLPFFSPSPLETSNSLNVNQNGWDLHVGPNVNATGHLVFDTVSSFLQEWPNTRYRHGHNIVPGSVPPGTLLYHGRRDNRLPTRDWVSVDPEHSLLFCYPKNPDSGCWHLTLVTSRTLKILYFDGSGAAKMEDGSMDTQDVVAWGKVIPEKFFDEKERINALCVWGQKFGLDGFVRMEMDFEIMLCDFTKGVEVESFLELRTTNKNGPPRVPSGLLLRNPNFLSRFPNHGEHSPSIPSTPPRAPDFEYPGLHSFSSDGPSWPKGVFDEVLNSGSWHGRFPGDTRIKLDLTRLVSFYDTSLVLSLVEVRFGKHRLEHRVLGASEEDFKRVMMKIEEVLAKDGAEDNRVSVGRSPIDWKALFHVLIDRYGNRLEVVRYLLNFTDTDTHGDDGERENEEDDEKYLARAKSVQEQLQIMLRPYIIYSAIPPSSPESDSVSWASPIFKLCATTHTRYISSQSLPASETLLLNAFQETNREICRVITRMWVRGVIDGGLDQELSPHPRVKPSDDVEDANTHPYVAEADDGNVNLSLKSLLAIWQQEITTLMSWLDWSVWLKCRPECRFDEFCYLPTWPYFRRDAEKRWKDPQPMCIRRLQVV